MGKEGHVMTLEQCYASIEADYQDVLRRLRSEKLVQKFVIKFLDDPSFQELLASIEARKSEEAFRAAHTLKGVSQNLGFTPLFTASSTLTEALRNGFPADVDSLLLPVKEAYENTSSAIQCFLKEQEGN